MPRRENDFYPTPPEFTDFVVKYLLRPEITANKPLATQGRVLRVLDAGCGPHSPWVESLRRCYDGPLYTVGVDLPCFQTCDNVAEYHATDFLLWIAQYRGEPFDLVIGNPPYENDLPERWGLRIMKRLLSPTGMLAWLLRSSWDTSQKRYRKFFSAGRHPVKKWISACRLSFTDDGKTGDKEDHAVYLFRRDWPHNWGITAGFHYREGTYQPTPDTNQLHFAAQAVIKVYQPYLFLPA